MINFTKTPSRYTPANNPVIYGFSGSSDNLIFFRVNLIEESSLSTVYTGNAYPLPTNPSVANINLSKQLGSIVRPDVDNLSTIVTGKTIPIVGYYLDVQEYGISGGTLTTLDSGYTSDIAYAFDAGIDIQNFTENYATSRYVIVEEFTTDTIPANFLTFQPNNKAVNDYSFEQLYFLQDNNDYLSIDINVGGTVYNIPYSASPESVYVISPEVPETRAIGQITITGQTTSNYDNISISANTQLLGSYSANTTAYTTTQLATNIAAAISGNSYGYGVTTSANTIFISAPVGYGTSGNSITLATARQQKILLGFSGYSPDSLEASCEITGYTTYSAGSYVNITTNAPIFGNINLLGYTVTTGDTTLTAFTTNMVTQLNTNPYGFSATSLGTTFILTAPYSSGDIFNGTIINADYDSTGINYTMTGGATGSATTITFNSMIPNTLVQFSGGTDLIPAVTGLTMEKMIRIQTSPKKLMDYGVSGFVYNQNYTVSVSDASGNTVTEERTYVYKDVDCDVDYVNVVWTNALGGIDSYQFIQPQENQTTEKKSIKKNNINMSNEKPYITNGVYNQRNLIYDTNSKISIKVWTKELSDEDSVWLEGLVNSKNWWIETTLGYLIPATLSTTSYQVQKKRYNNKELVQYQFEFTFDDEYFPSISRFSSIIINNE